VSVSENLTCTAAWFGRHLFVYISVFCCEIWWDSWARSKYVAICSHHQICFAIPISFAFENFVIMEGPTDDCNHTWNGTVFAISGSTSLCYIYVSPWILVLTTAFYNRLYYICYHKIIVSRFLLQSLYLSAGRNQHSLGSHHSILL